MGEESAMFSGLMPAMVTPFDRQGELDFGASEAVIERFIEAGVDGISPLGSTGEATHLTFDERKRFAEEVVRIAAGRVPLVIGVGSSGTAEAVELACHAEDAGADAVLAVSPFYWKVGIQWVASILTCPRVHAPSADQTRALSRPRMRIMQRGSCSPKLAVG